MKLRNLCQLVFTFILLAMVSGCGYNTFQTRDEQVKSAAGQLQSAYQKRFDLVPNLVSVVKGYATHEKDLLIAVTQARSSVGSVKLPDNASPEEMKEFEDKQKQFSSALSRLLVVAENYPQLKADAGFRDLQQQLVNIENQINANRNRLIREIAAYNRVVRSFPTNLTAMVFGYSVKPQLTADEGAKTAPSVKF